MEEIKRIERLEKTLEEVTETLAQMSIILYNMTKVDKNYRRAFDDQMGNPIEELDRLFEVKK